MKHARGTALGEPIRRLGGIKTYGDRAYARDLPAGAGRHVRPHRAPQSLCSGKHCSFREAWEAEYGGRFERTRRMRVGLGLVLVVPIISILRGVYPDAPRLIVDAIESAHGLLVSMAHSSS